MTGVAPTRAPFAEARVFAIGSALSRPVKHLLGFSRWQVEEISDFAAAAARIEKGCIPVMFCDESNWRDVVEAARHSLHPPAILVLTAEPKNSEWEEIRRAGAHYLDIRNMDAEGLFSILNLLWHSWHKD